MSGITVNPNAVAHLRAKLKSNPEADGIRIKVVSSGCSGYAYSLDYAKKTEGVEDIVINDNNIAIYVDKKSMQYLQGTELYVVKEGLNEHLKFNNPNAVNACGCGESFNFKHESS